MHTIRIFGWSIGVSVFALAAAFFYGATRNIGFSIGAGLATLALTAMLGVFETTLSFDNAIVNATILRKMSPFWQTMFLTVGVFIAVFGMRLAMPIAIVCIAARISPWDAIQLTFAGGSPDTPGTFGYIITSAHPMIAGFGGTFLFMLALNYFLDGERDVMWLWPLEKFLARIGSLEYATVIITLVTLVVSAELLAEDPPVVLLSGVIGLVTYLVVNGLGNYFEARLPDGDESTGGQSKIVLATGRAAASLFLYLEILDATFSFDGVIGAFAISNDPVVIALGLGLIGAMFVRSITVYLVRKGTLDDYEYLESGAHWAIFALAVILLLTIGIHVNEIITGLVGIIIIALAFWASLRRNKRKSKEWGGPEAVELAPAHN